MRLLAPWLSLVIALGGILSACADSPSAPDPGLKRFGWRSAGLVLPDAGVKNGLISLVAIGNTLFAMQAIEPPGAPVSRPRQWRIWKGSVGSETWVQLPMPDGETPSEWAVVGGKLVVGTRYTGRLYSYDPGAGKWKQFKIPVLPGLDTDSLPYVSGVGSLEGKVTAAIARNFGKNNRCFFQGDAADSLIMIPCMGKSNAMPFYAAGHIGSYLYGYQSEWGVHRYQEGDTAWEALPSARGRTDPAEWEYLSALSVVDGKLYVGYEGWNDGIFRWDDGKWTSMTPLDSLKRRETSQTVRVIAGHRGRLFQAGRGGSGIAMLVPRDSGRVQWGDWRLVDSGWCEIASWCPSETWGIVGIGDTLYAAAWNFIAKVPFAELDSMARPMFRK